jgi:type I restriction enzyme S subunit
MIDQNTQQIPTGWKIEALRDVVKIIKDQWKPGDDECRYIGLEHVNQGDLSINGFGSSGNLESNKYHFRSGDILFGKLRPYFRKVYKPNFDGVCSTDIWVIRAKENNNQGFLFYFFANQDFVDKASKANSGTKMPRADWSYLEKERFVFPSCPEQRAIASVLSAFDDKIELLREQNKTLEAIAQTLFNRWFVEFNFPDENGQPYHNSGGNMIDSELGEIPEGWKVGKIKDFVDIICGKTPSKSIHAYFGGDIPFIKIPDMHDQVFVIKTEDSLTEQGANTQRNKFLPENSICVSCIATVGLVSITSKKSQTNQQINSIIPKSGNYLEYLYFSLKAMKDDLIAIGGGGSATLNINTGTFANIEIIYSDENMLKQFHDITNPVFQKIRFNSEQIQTLSQLRDTLLPKLMRGEVRVNS